ncbi:MAG: hypothetical protein KBC91_07550, partial [Candidatus Omnitrophica bacterium]|nr:hypothetical protein [Candidatus Omnitrophota bacterium]
MSLKDNRTKHDAPTKAGLFLPFLLLSRLSPCASPRPRTLEIFRLPLWYIPPHVSTSNRFSRTTPAHPFSGGFSRRATVLSIAQNH